MIVHATAQCAYEFWLHFERFPEFMEGIQLVRRLDETRLCRRENFAGQAVEWEVEVTVRIPHNRISWRSRSGFSHSGTVSFEEHEPGETAVTLGMIFDPTDIRMEEQAAKDFLAASFERTLERFKRLVEPLS